MTDEELFEKIKKRKEEQKQEKQIITFEQDSETNEITPTVHYDRLSPEDRLYLNIQARKDETKKSDYATAKEIADSIYDSYAGLSRNDLATLYNSHGQKSVEAIEKNDTVEYYKNELLRTKLRKQLGETTPQTFMEDLGEGVGEGIAKFPAGLADIAARAKIGLETSLDPNFTYYGSDKITAQKKAQEAQAENERKFKEYQQNSGVGQFTSGVQEAGKVLETKKDLGYGLAGQLGLSAAETVANVGTSALLGGAVGKVAGSTAGYWGGLGTMAASAGGNTTTELLNQGVGWNQALERGLTDGMLEFVTEAVGGESLGKILLGTKKAVTPLGKVVNKVINKMGVKNLWLKTAVGIAGNVASEAIEEMVAESISPFLDQSILGIPITDWEAYGENIGMAGLQSIIPTLILSGYNRVQVSNIIKTQTEKMVLAVETSPYLTDEKKQQLRDGLVQAYNNAAHLLSDEESEEQFEQISQDVEKALGEAAQKYKSAQDLAYLLTQIKNQKAQQEQQAMVEAQSLVNRQNAAQQQAQSVVNNQKIKTALGTKLQQSSQDAGYQTVDGIQLEKYKSGQNTGDNYTDGTNIYKKTANTGGKTTLESDIYTRLKDVPNIAKGEVVDVIDKETGEVVQMIKTPKFDHVLSVDDVEKDKRERVAQRTDFLDRNKVLKLAKAINEISNKGILYNDPLQVGYTKGEPYIFDFSSSMADRKDYTNEQIAKTNYQELVRFLDTFGAKELANQIEGAIDLLDRLDGMEEGTKWAAEANLNDYEKRVFDEVADTIIKYKVNPHNVYFVSNAREIPKREGNNEILRTRNRITEYGPMLVFSQEPLSEKFIDDWELTPIYENRAKNLHEKQKSGTKNVKEATQKSGKNVESLDGIKVGEKYEVEYDGENYTIEVVSIDKTKKEALVRTSTPSKSWNQDVLATMKIEDLKARIEQLKERSKREFKAGPDVYEVMKKAGQTEVLSNNVEYLKLGRFNKVDYGIFDKAKLPTIKELNEAPVLIELYRVPTGSEIVPKEIRVYKNITDLRKDLPISWLNKNTKQGPNGYFIYSLAGKGKFSFQNSPYHKAYTWWHGQERLVDIVPDKKPLKRLETKKKEVNAQFEKLKEDYKDVGEFLIENGVEKIELNRGASLESQYIPGISGRDTTQQELNNLPVALTVYGKSGTSINIYPNVKELLKDVKEAYGGFEQLVGKGKDKLRYGIQSMGGIGEFYLERNSKYKGGWVWKDYNDWLVEGWETRGFRKRLSSDNQENSSENLSTKFNNDKIAFEKDITTKGDSGNGKYSGRENKNDRRGFEQQDNTSSRNNNKNLRKLGKVIEISEGQQGEIDGRNSNNVYKKANENIIDRAKRQFGTTKDFKFGAYLFPDGTLLKLERNGRRGGHYLIEQLGTTQERLMDETGTIRLVPENGSIQISKEPTNQQYAKLENFVEYLQHNMPNDDYEIWVEIKGKSEPFIYDNKKVGKRITNDIKEYFNNEKTSKNSAQGSFLLPEKSLSDSKPTDKLYTTQENPIQSLIERKIQYKEAGLINKEDYDVTSLTEIRKYINKELLKGKFKVGQFRTRALGIFQHNSNWVSIDQISDIETLLHEIGHFIDFTILEQFYKKHPEMKEELKAICKMSFGKTYDNSLEKQLREGFAESVRLFLIDPKELTSIAPNTANLITQEFENTPQLKELYQNIQKMVHDYIFMSPQERIHSKIQNPSTDSAFKKLLSKRYGEVSIDGRFKNTLRLLTTKIFNRQEAATFFDNKMQKAYEIKYGKGVKLPSALKLFDNIRRADSSGEAIFQQFKNGIYNPLTGRKITQGLSKILRPLVKEAKMVAKQKGVKVDEYLNKRLNDLMDLAYAQRTNEISLRNEQDGTSIETGIRLQDAKDVMKKFKDDTILHDVLGDIREVGKSILQYAETKGVIKKGVAQKIYNSNIFYMPLNRILGDYDTYGGIAQNGSTGDPYMRLVGSDRDIRNPFVTMIENWGRVLRTIDNNIVMQKLVDVGKDVGDYGDFFVEVPPIMQYRGAVSLGDFEKYLELVLSPEEFNKIDLDQTYQLFVPEKSDPSKMTVSYLRNGVRKYIKFANNDYGRPLYELLTNLNAKQSSDVLRIISRFNQSIRLGATALNPFFAMSNVMSDQLQAFLYSKGMIIPLVNGIFDAVRLMRARKVIDADGSLSLSQAHIKKNYEEFLRSGASLSGKFKLDEKSLLEVVPDMWGVSNEALFGKNGSIKVRDFFQKFGKILAYLPEFSEEMTRFGEFCRVKEMLLREGKSNSQAVMEAGIAAKEITQDFSIQGETMQTVNKLLPFSAAKVGGLTRYAQEMRNHPGRLSFRMGILIGMAVLLAQARHGDDDAEKYYEELNYRKKFDNFVFPVGGATPFVIKKPQGVPRYFLNLAEYIYDLSTGYIPKGEEKKRLKDWLTLSLEDQLPISGPTDMIPGFAQPLLENILNQDFYYGSKIVPQDLEKLDPRHQYNAYTSELGKALGNILNYSPMKIDNFIEGTFAGMGSWTLEATDWLYDLATGDTSAIKNPLGIVSRAESRIHADVYRSSESVNTVYDRISEYEREDAEGRLTPEQQEDYDKMKVAKNSMAKINKEIKATRADSTLNAEQKAKKISELYELRTDTARYYLGKGVLNESSEEKISLFKYYPASESYKYEVGNKKVDVYFTDKDNQEYAEMLKKNYEKELNKLKNKSKYKNATAEEKAKQEKNLLQSERIKVNDVMVEKAYRRSK